MFNPEIGYSYFMANNRHRMKGTRIHIRAIIEGNNIVYRWYGAHKQWWHYEICGIEDLDYLYQAKVLSKKKRSLNV